MKVRGALFEGVALVVIAFLPILADATRQQVTRCAQDGQAVEPAFAVTVEFEHGPELPFCGVACAERWLTNSGRVAQRVIVTDCVRGDRLDARRAFYVRTYVGQGERVPDEIRVFASRKEAGAHIQAYGGEFVDQPTVFQLNGPLELNFSGRRRTAND
jgi:hypothetical protein